MAEVVASMFMDLALGRIKNLIDTYISDQYEYQTTDVKLKLQQMASSFTKIKALVDVAGKMEIEENESLVEWLSELKNAIYDAEYVMDVFEYQRLKNDVEGWPELTPEVANKGKVRHFFKLSLACCTKVQENASVVAKRLFFADEDLNDLLQVVTKFDNLVKDMNNFTSLLQLYHAIQHPLVRPDYAADQELEGRVTTSAPVELKLFGRDEAEAKLLKLLLESSDGNDTRSFSVVSVVGVGGVGKTTLAQSVFNHKSLKSDFEIKAWVCVSTNFSIANLTKDIIEDAEIERPADYNSLTTLGRIQDVLTKGLRSKRFLIVLDDVWEDMQHDKWEKLCIPFRNGKEGSKILVTSRDHNVDKIMGVEKKMHMDLSPLQFEYYWEFFQKCAFLNEDPEKYPQLKKIGEGIAQKLGGLPLAAKIVGRVLSTNLSTGHWKDVSNSKVWREENGVVSALKLSYDHLPTHLKKCFAYCCLFPKDHKYKVETLVDMWVALDCVRSEDKNKRLVDIQKTYIHGLVNRCFFEVSSTSGDDDIYVMHDLLHDLAEKIIGNEVYRVEDDESLSRNVAQLHYVRHLYIKSSTYNGLDLVLQKLNIAPKQLRSLVYVVPQANVEEKEFKMSKKTTQILKGLRLLIFSSEYCIWENLGDLLHLRCTNFRSISVFPASFWKLYQLEILRWQSEGEVKKCTHLHKLINLRYANNYVKFSDPEIITSYLGDLKSLEVLPGCQFIVNREPGNDIGQLKELDKIGGELILHVHVKLSKEEARKVNLNRKHYLTGLTIVDNFSKENEEGGIEAESIEALQPHESLEKLCIFKCKSITTAPTWLPMLSDLTTLALVNLPNLQLIHPHLGYRLSSLKYLYLSSLTSVKQIDIGYSKELVVFPSLIIVRMHDMITLEGWSLHNSYNHYTTKICPKLSTIQISNCPKLLAKGDSIQNRIIFPLPYSECNIRLIFGPKREDKLDDDADKVIEIHIDSESFLPARDSYNAEATSMFLRHVKEMVISQYTVTELINLLPATLLHKFSSLEVLTIDNCIDLESLDDIARHLPPANKLVIKLCSKLKFLSAADGVDNVLLPTFKALNIRECNELMFLFARPQFPSLENIRIHYCSSLSLVADDVNDDQLKTLLTPINKLFYDGSTKLKLSPAVRLMIKDIRTTSPIFSNMIRRYRSDMANKHNSNQQHELEWMPSVTSEMENDFARWLAASSGKFR